MITGTLGDVHDYTMVHVHIEGQCDNAHLALYPTPPLPDYTAYELDDPAIELNLSTDNVLSKNIHRYCGEPTFLIFNKDGTALDPRLFE